MKKASLIFLLLSLFAASVFAQDSDFDDFDLNESESFEIDDFDSIFDDAVDVEEAIVTAGGINIKEINPKTMESKIINNLFFAGEVIDVDAYTGGFNLQIAYSTGYTAGLNTKG